jgi:hypothetical protein
MNWSAAEAARRVCQRHDLDHRDAQIGQLLDLPGYGRKGPLLGEGAHVHLVEHLILAHDAFPSGIRPGKRCRVNEL